MADNNANTNHDNFIAWTFILIVLAAICWLIWYFYDTEIRNVIRWIRYGEMWLLSWFIPDNYTVAYGGREIGWHAGFKAASQITASDLKNEHLGLFSILAMQPLKYVYCGLLTAGAFWCLSFGPRTQNRQSLGLEGLIEFQAQNFPVITPFIKFNPSKQPPRPPGTPVPAELPQFAEALGPEEWLAYNNIPVPDGKLDEEAAAKAFKKQLIGRWKGVKALKAYQQVLFASFCLKASRKRNEADEILGRLSCCWDSEKGLQLSKDKTLLKEARKIISNKDLASKTIAEANRHAYVTTAMIRALQYAREEGGVLAPATFVWLRAHDRVLWYPLNNLGRQSFHMEALGAMAHFKAERLTRRPIPTPKIDFAVDSISEYMQSGDARPIPSLNYEGSSKRAIKKAT